MKLAGFLFSMAFLYCQTANASIITLDGNDIRNPGSFVEDDYMITAAVNRVNGRLTSQQHLVEVGFSGDYMETWNTDAVFTLSEIDGGLFVVVGLDVGSYFNRNNALAAWTFRGFNGSAELYSLLNNQLLGRLDLAWTGLTSFTIPSSRATAASSFDNIEVVKREPKLRSAVIFDPTGLAFFSLVGFACLARSRRAKK